MPSAGNGRAARCVSPRVTSCRNRGTRMAPFGTSGVPAAMTQAAIARVATEGNGRRSPQRSLRIATDPLARRRFALCSLAIEGKPATPAPAGGGRNRVGMRSPPSEALALTPSGDDDTGACQRRLLATPAFLLLGPGRSERVRIAHVVPAGRDPAVGPLDMRDAELVDMAVEGIGDPASPIEISGPGCSATGVDAPHRPGRGRGFRDRIAQSQLQSRAVGSR
jgi:hypothetical protein